MHSINLHYSTVSGWTAHCEDAAVGTRATTRLDAIYKIMQNLNTSTASESNRQDAIYELEKPGHYRFKEQYGQSMDSLPDSIPPYR